MGIKESMAKLNKAYGEGTVGDMGGSRGAGDVIPTGLLSLDLALGSMGYPRGRIVELYGPESAGKSTLALMAVREAQKKGLICAYVDAEHALDEGLADIVGIDRSPSKFIIARPECGEHGVEITKELIDSGEVGCIVVDSVATLVPRSEMEGEVGDAQMGAHARLMSQAMRLLISPVSRTNTLLIFINQIRMKIGVMYGNPETTTGGRALPFAASQRIEVRRVAAIKDGENVIGAKTRCKVSKNKFAPPFRTTEFDLIYGTCPDPMLDMVNVAIEKGIIAKAGSWYKMGDVSLGQGAMGVVRSLADKPDVLEAIKKGVMSCIS